MAQAKRYYDASTEHTPFPKRGAGGQLTEDGPKRHPNKRRASGAKAPVSSLEA